MGEFDGRAAIVTGGAMGIGNGIARGLAGAGAKVAIADVDAAAATALADELRVGGATVITTVGDVSNAADAQRMVAEAEAAFGRLDVLVSNAGIQPMDWYFPVDEMPEEIWDRIISVNLKGAFLMSKYAVPAIRRAGGGSIVVISSVQGLQSMPRVPAYAASKGGLLSLVRNMAMDYAPEGIRVTAICPGTIDSEMVRRSAIAEGGDIEANLKRYGAIHPLGRLGRPEDIANAVLFLASDRGSFITGEYLCVDGGFMARGAWATSAGAER